MELFGGNSKEDRIKNLQELEEWLCYLAQKDNIEIIEIIQSMLGGPLEALEMTIARTALVAVAYKIRGEWECLNDLG